MTEETAGRIDLVVRTLTDRSRSDTRGLFAHDCVRLNGEVCGEPGTVTRSGDVVGVRHDPHRRYHAPPPERPNSAFQSVYEDQQILVVDKAAHLLTVPTERNERNTLLEAVTRHLERRHPRARPGVVHRLDRGTSGLLVFGVTDRVARVLQEQFRVRKAAREYVAIVAGLVEPEEGVFSTRLGTTRSLQRRSVGEGEDGETAITHFRVVERLRDATVVIARLETGRRNQIRVQFAEAGHPVLGDERYEPQLARHRGWKAKRLALHAAVLGFDHPVTGQPLRFESPWPDEFRRFCARNRPGSM